ncbi:hypothetical protein MVEN_00873200 [Mycena venus]|uniref:Uncharacterized protein n=1 Tax=Mycena venus TaxID=2733690 RepID=A0A8H7D4A4_9AGAR|nr:hypothetical protein MVEN_00873200 [Mycena venus]
MRKRWKADASAPTYSPPRVEKGKGKAPVQAEAMDIDVDGEVDVTIDASAYLVHHRRLSLAARPPPPRFRSPLTPPPLPSLHAPTPARASSAALRRPAPTLCPPACSACVPSLNKSQSAFGVTVAGEFSNGYKGMMEDELILVPHPRRPLVGGHLSAAEEAHLARAYSVADPQTYHCECLLWTIFAIQDELPTWGGLDDDEVELENDCGISCALYVGSSVSYAPSSSFHGSGVSLDYGASSTSSGATHPFSQLHTHSNSSSAAPVATLTPKTIPSRPLPTLGSRFDFAAGSAVTKAVVHDTEPDLDANGFGDASADVNIEDDWGKGKCKVPAEDMGTSPPSSPQHEWERNVTVLPHTEGGATTTAAAGVGGAQSLRTA